MQSVKNVVCIVKVESYKENCKQNNMSNLFFCVDLVAECIQRKENYSKNSTVHVGKNGVAAASDCGFKRGEMVGDKVKNRIVESCFRGECA